MLRPYHFFISYSHTDARFANDLKNWLSGTAGLRVWFDESDLRSGERVQADIATSISQCRGIIFLLSKNSHASKFVPDELDQALAEKKENSRFQMVLLRIDDVDITANWKTIRTLKWLDLATREGPRLDLLAATEILCRLHAYDSWQDRLRDLKEVFVSGGWREGEEDFVDEICQRLAVRGLRLVGDLPSQDKSDQERAAGIIRGCWGHAIVLPRRSSGGGPQAAYKYFLQERGISMSLGVPRVVFTLPGSDLPPELAAEAFVVEPEMLGKTREGAGSMQDRIYDFVDGLEKPNFEVHAFFSADYQGNQQRNSLARAVVEATGSLPCYWGRDYSGMNIQGSIKDAISSAKFVVADLTSRETTLEPLAGKPRANVNTCIEAGIAWGANTRLLLLAEANLEASQPQVEGKTKYVPFMFRNSQLDLYSDSVPSLAPGVEFLGAVHKAVREYRKKYGRRVINCELGL